MKYQRGHKSADVVDRRGAGPTGGMSMGKIGGGVGGLGILIVLLMSCLGSGGGIDIGSLPTQELEPPAPGGAAGAQGADPIPEATDALDRAEDPDAELVAFLSFVLDDVQEYWSDQFAASGQDYDRAKLVLFTGSTQSGCGGATAAIGPHYCPLDQHAYLDLDFFKELLARFDAPGDFAQAYVLAHEIGHHVQTVTGISAEVRRLSQQHPGQANDLSILQELQADCFAGVWAYSTYDEGLLESGDVQEGLDAAAAVGDDRIQQKSTGRIDPESWTHGSSAQREKWFTIGFETGDPEACNTFSQGA
jgi:hypothetical protein